MQYYLIDSTQTSFKILKDDGDPENAADDEDANDEDDEIL